MEPGLAGRNLVPRVSLPPAPLSLQGAGRKRDPGNDVEQAGLERPAEIGSKNEKLKPSSYFYSFECTLKDTVTAKNSGVS